MRYNSKMLTQKCLDGPGDYNHEGEKVRALVVEIHTRVMNNNRQLTQLMDFIANGFYSENPVLNKSLIIFGGFYRRGLVSEILGEREAPRDNDIDIDVMFENGWDGWYDYLNKHTTGFSLNHRGHRVYKFGETLIDTYEYRQFQNFGARNAQEALSWMDLGINAFAYDFSQSRFMNVLSWKGNILSGGKLDVEINRKRWDRALVVSQSELLILCIRLLRILENPNLGVAPLDKVYLKDNIIPILEGTMNLWFGVQHRMQGVSYTVFMSRMKSFILS